MCFKPADGDGGCDVGARWDDGPWVPFDRVAAVFGGPSTSWGSWLYRHAQPGAYLAKIILQMAIGAGAAFKIGVLVLGGTADAPWSVEFGLATEQTLAIIGGALAVAAAIELAYTLFTPGPDEALDPLMLGLSAALLLLMSKDTPQFVPQFVAALIGVVALGVLFQIRRLLNENAKR